MTILNVLLEQSSKVRVELFIQTNYKNITYLGYEVYVSKEHQDFTFENYSI